MPFMASLTADERGPHGEEPSDSPEAEIRDMMTYYHAITDDPGEVVLPIVPTESTVDYLETCDKLGATWELTADIVGEGATE